jgi:uncharacterized phiE125 gp8 family phage protein
MNDGKRYRSLKVATQPVVEPVSVADAKAQLRIDHNSDDTYIAALISAAREYCETYMDETLVDTQYVMRLDAFPAAIELPRPPMSQTAGRTAVSIVYTASEAGNTATLSTTEYRVDRDAKPGTLRTLYAGSWPSHLLDYGSVTVTWWGGRGDDGSKVSPRVKAAILMLVGQWYERRMAADSVSLSEMPFGVKALLDSVKWGSYT